MEKKKYFDVPKQVMWYDYSGNHWASGIAYCGEIICSCCGGIEEIEDIYGFAPDHIENPIVEFEDWIDLSNEIQGDIQPTKVLYGLFVDFGGLENIYEGVFEDENDRNEMALSYAEEIEWCNFNLNVAAWNHYNDDYAVQIAMAYARDWAHSRVTVQTWEDNIYV